jgi:hypothetical protein
MPKPPLHHGATTQCLAAEPVHVFQLAIVQRRRRAGGAHGEAQHQLGVEGQGWEVW